jgi:hypothetical protein
MILAVRVLSGLPYKAARLVWLFLMASATAFALGWFSRLLGASTRTAAVVGVGSLAIPVVQTDLIYGQSNGVLLLLFVVAWWGLRRKNDALAGSALGLSAAIKLFPALMILPLLRFRRFRAAVWLACVALATTLVSGSILGLGFTKEFFRDVSPANFRFWRSAPMNESLLSVPYRWLTHSVWPPHATNRPTVALVIAGALFVALILGMYTGRARITGDEFWESVPFLLLATPIVWETYLVLLIPFTFLVAKQLIDRNPIPSRVIVLPALAILGIGLWPGLPSVLHASMVAQTLGFSWPMYALLILVCVSYWGRRENTRHVFSRLQLTGTTNR